MNLDKLLTNGWKFEESEIDLKHKFQVVYIIVVLTIVALIFAILNNFFSGIEGFIPVEIVLAVCGIIMCIALRNSKKYLGLIVNILTIEYSLFILFLLYMGNPNDMKQMWIVTYPIVLLNLQRIRVAKYWLLFFIFFVIIAPIQNIISVQYNLHQMLYITFVLIIVTMIVYFYKYTIEKSTKLILEQQEKLKAFNEELEDNVNKKTLALRELNESLEIRVQNKIEELVQKDKILTIQSKQAVMGEMISMIAHQWRQPLSTITLQISNLQFSNLLGSKVDEKNLDKTLSEISDTIIYLSNTIDDFQTYFHPDKKKDKIELHELINRAINFAMPRINESGVKLIFEKDSDIIIETYTNEFIQVVLNLLNNSIDVLVEKKIPNKKIIINISDKKDIVKIYVEDNAGGIEEAHIKQIFEPYFSTKGKNGTGLGLYMSQMIIEKQFKGLLSVQNSKYGAIFIIKIPKYLD